MSTIKIHSLQELRRQAEKALLAGCQRIRLTYKPSPFNELARMRAPKINVNGRENQL